MHVWNVLQAARWKHRTQKLRPKSPSVHHRTTLSGYIFASKTCIDNWKNLLNGNISSGPLTAEIRWGVWGTPATFNGFRVLASLLHRRRSTEVNQTLHDVCLAVSCAGIQYCIYIFGAVAPWWNFVSCKIHFASKSCFLLYWQRYCTALEQWASAKVWGVVQGMELRNFRRGCHLYSAGRPSRRASAHILVSFVFARYHRRAYSLKQHFYLPWRF